MTHINDAPARSAWKWKLARHVAAYTILGMLATALTGAFCGALVGGSLGWRAVGMPGGGAFEYPTVFASVGAMVGAVGGVVPGAIIFLIAGFRSGPKGFWRQLGRDLRVVLGAMTLGAFGSALTLALLGYAGGLLGANFEWREYAVWGCPLAMICGAIVGACFGLSRPRNMGR